MTIDNEVKALTKVCRLLANGLRGDALSLLDTIDAVDDEPEQPAKCKHNGAMIPIFTLPRGAARVYDVIVCLGCGTIGRIDKLDHATEWWPEGGAK